jgi:hypothetical protein
MGSRVLSRGIEAARVSGLMVLFCLALVCVSAGSASASTGPASAQLRAHKRGYSLTPSTTEPYLACRPPKPKRYGCFAIVSPANRANPNTIGSGEKGGLDPQELREAYGISETGGSTQTIAIVDAFDDPNAESDLQKYREHYKVDYRSGETACTTTNGCFRKVNQEGKPEKFPEGNESWATEISLDLDMASALCPECKILLVEAETNGAEDLDPANNEAALLGATEINDSWGGLEGGEYSEDLDFDHPGIPITVAAGDSGYGICGEAAGVCYPAASRYVISVGGTELKKGSSWEQSAWIKSGGGCSLHEEKPPWQTDWGCAKRLDNDVAADAAESSAVSVYDSYVHSGWMLVWGTSGAAPIVAGVEAHASKAVREEGAKAFYSHSLSDVSKGMSGFCSDTYLCVAQEGYDGLTGWGSPNGPLANAAGFEAVTGQATGVGQSAATLNGYVDPEGSTTTYHFEYGTSTAYGLKAPVPDAGAGAGTLLTAVKQGVTGLAQQTTYHYRLVATNSSGTVYGKDHTFVTAPWTAEKVQQPGNTSEATYNGALSGVSCPSVSVCTAVGHYENSSKAIEPLAEQWNGTEWLSQTITAAQGGELTSVSCSAVGACTAVGHYESGTLADRWNGKEWVQQLPRNPEGAKGLVLEGVSCPASETCVAVGHYKLSAVAEAMIAEKWNGSEWALGEASPPAGFTSAKLSSVSCVSTSACTAVGVGTNAEGKTVGLVEQWNGKTWSSQQVMGASKLTSISCASTAACTAIGGALTAYRWNGTEWREQTLPSPIAADESYQYGELGVTQAVSCTSAARCVAVGHLVRESETTTMAEVWNGREWRVEGAPRLETAKLGGVSCPSVTACLAVGSSFGYVYPPTEPEGAIHTVPLAEVASMPSPSRATSLDWLIAGKELASGESRALAEAATVTSALTIKASFGGTEVRVECKTLSGKGGKIKGKEAGAGGTSEAEALRFSACELAGPFAAKCEVQGKEFSTGAVSGKLEEVEFLVKDAIVPKSGSTLASLSFLNKGSEVCPAYVRGVKNLAGEIVAILPQPGAEQAHHKLEFTATSGTSVKLGENAAEFSGAAEVELASKEAFGTTFVPDWVINGQAMTAGEVQAVAEAATVTSALTVKASFGGSELKLECKTLNAKGATIKGQEGLGEAEVLRFSACEVAGPFASKCEVSGKEFSTGAVISKLEGGESAFKDKLAPKSGTTLASLSFLNKGSEVCPPYLRGVRNLTGSVTANIPLAGTEQTHHALEFTAASGTSIKLGENTAELVGSAEIELPSKETFAVG